MPRRTLKELKDGESVDEIFLLADKQLRANRNANLYLLATLRDRSGSISGLMWNVTEDAVAHVQPGDFVRAYGKVQSFQGALQIILTRIDHVPPTGLDPADFQRTSGQDVERNATRLRELLLGIGSPALRTLAECFLIDEALMRAVREAPAGVKAHHAYQGGLLEHVVNILETADRIADLYPRVDFDLVKLGIFLHDIGKTRELAWEASLVYTDEGQLLGHLVLAVEMLDEKLAAYRDLTGEPFPTEAALRLKHIILSHHGTYEYGSPRLPMTPEAVVVHLLDNLDAKVHEFVRTIEEDPNAQSRWTPFSTRLDRKLFKGDPNAAPRPTDA